jgi:hypothetical protein
MCSPGITQMPLQSRTADQGSMLWKQFSAKKLAFFLNTIVMINFFQNLALFWVKNANFVAKIFGENILKKS